MDDFFCEMSEEEIDISCKNIARVISKSQKIVILTGAGISVSSGIPDFRSSNGLWKKYDPKVYANYTNFLNQPELFWKMTNELKKTLLNKKPTKSHFALTELQNIGKLDCLITQNIDNLHQLSGTKNVIELHGSGKICHCISCDYQGNIDIVLPNDLIPWIDIPRCPLCGNLVKLDVVLFGEKLQNENFEKAFDYASNCDVFIVIGSSLEVMPANALPRKAKMNAATCVLINKSCTRYDNSFDYVVNGDCDIIVPKLVEYVLEYNKMSCVNKFFNSLTFPVQIIKNPMESLTQLVASIVDWIGPKQNQEEILNCLVDSSDSIQQVVTSSPHPNDDELLNSIDQQEEEEENNKADKIMEEIRSSSTLRNLNEIEEEEVFLSSDDD